MQTHTEIVLDYMDTSVSDPYSLNPDPAKNLNADPDPDPDPDAGKFFSLT